MPYESFLDFDLWQQAADLADAVFDVGRIIEDAAIRTQLTSSVVLVPFYIGEAATRQATADMNAHMERAKAPLRDVRALLNECRQQGLGTGTDFAFLDEECGKLEAAIHASISGGDEVTPDGGTETSAGASMGESI